jgi:TRAP-type C4-dicarboxylate transport system permease small subunit
VREKGILFLRSFAQVLDRISSLACAFMLGTMTLAVLAGVVFRYVFLNPLGWTEELSRYLMIWTASLAISVGIYHGEHIGLTFLPDRISGKYPKILLNLGVNLLILLFLSVMLFYSLGMVRDAKFQIAQSLPISMVIPSLAIPVTMGIAMIQNLIQIALLLLGWEPDIERPRNVDV